MWQYCRELSLQAISRLLRTHDAVQSMLTILAYAGALFGLPFVGVSPWWFVIGIGLLFLYFLLRVAYERDENSKHKLQEHLIEIQTLKDHSKPKIEIRFGPKGAFEHDFISNGVKSRLFRVAIVNIGGATIFEVVVRLARLVPLLPTLSEESSIYPIILHQQHDNPLGDEPYRESFTLHSETPQYIDVVSKPLRARGYNDELQLWYVSKTVRPFVSCRPYKINIEVAGRDVRSVNEWFVVDVDEAGTLLFRSEKGMSA